MKSGHALRAKQLRGSREVPAVLSGDLDRGCGMFGGWGESGFTARTRMCCHIRNTTSPLQISEHKVSPPRPGQREGAFYNLNLSPVVRMNRAWE